LFLETVLLPCPHGHHPFQTPGSMRTYQRILMSPLLSGLFLLQSIP
jgi:hypothetical protein